jgi:hypothetical protein
MLAGAVSAPDSLLTRPGEIAKLLTATAPLLFDPVEFHAPDIPLSYQKSVAENEFGGFWSIQPDAHRCGAA